MQDGALFINRKAGKIIAEKYEVNIPTENANQTSGLKHDVDTSAASVVWKDALQSS